MSDFMSLKRTIPGWDTDQPRGSEYPIGVLPGEGIGPEVIDAALKVLDAVSAGKQVRFKIERGGKIGLPAQEETGCALTREVISFCQDIFQQKGAILCGPAGGRFVYDLRAHFDLFCKIVPLRPLVGSPDFGVLKADAVKGADVVVVRENSGGIYLGDWQTEYRNDHVTASHTFEYRSDQVERILRVAAGLAKRRRRRLTLVVKSEGMPAVSCLWARGLNELAKDSGLHCEVLQADNAAYQLIRAPRDFDVIVTTNLLGDILGDCGALIMGSRGMSFSGNFGKARKAVYQTGHGAAHDLAGRDEANPVAQILSIAMLLRISFGLEGMADRIEAAVTKTLEAGWRTPDIASPGCRLVGTGEMGCRIADAVHAIGDTAHSVGPEGGA